jgi:hypothetical protein
MTVIGLSTLSLKRDQLGDEADYWTAVAQGKPPDGKWLQKLPLIVSGKFAADLSSITQHRITLDGDAVVFTAFGKPSK